VRATDEKRIDAALAAGGEIMKLYRKEANPQAYIAVMHQADGKPPEALQATGPGGGPIIVEVPWGAQSTADKDSASWSRGVFLNEVLDRC